MPLTNMVRSKREMSAEVQPCEVDAAKYPYGLRISLENADLKKLDMASLPDVGEEMIVVGVGRVVSANEHKRQKGVDRNVQIQLEKIEVGPLKEETAADAVDKALKDL